MGLENFVPKKWWAKVFVRLRAILVHAATVNREYEGEIRQSGDEVLINELDAIGVSTYNKNTDITWSNASSYQKILRINQAKYYARNLDDIDKVQANVALMDAIADEAAFGMMKARDTFIAGKYSEAGNSVTAATVTAGSILVTMTEMQYQLDNANCPTDNRFFPIAPWFHRNLEQALTGAIIGHTATVKLFDNGLLINGYIGRLNGFNLLLTTQVNNNGSVWNNMAYHRSAIAFAGQLQEVELVRREARFGFGLKALDLYGGKVVRPNAMVTQAATAG